MASIQVDVRWPGGSGRFEFPEPDTCPLCHYAGKPAALLGNGSHHPQKKDGRQVEVVFCCPRGECCRLYIGRYHFDGADMVLEKLVPHEVEEPKVPEGVAKMSPRFAKIYSQAKEAEDLGLDEICGAGYRKALEFLIKDYCTTLDPAAKEKIRTEFLGTTIKERIESKNIKKAAERAAWLGNDEAHYIRRWDDKDIQDLNNLIELTQYHIGSEQLMSRYEDDMPENAT